MKRLEDGQNKAVAAIAAVDALRRESGNLANLFAEEQAIEERRKSAYEKIMQQTAVKEKLEQLSKSYAELLTDNHPQRRGFELERLLRELFAVFDLDPKASFRLSGEQIDGAFTFEGTDYLLEAKWQMQPIGTAELDTMAGKLSRKLDNTLGLFLSINGFSEEGVRAHQTGRRLLLLMDGSDLMAVLEGRIDLMQLLLRKRREASRTGNVYLRIHEILCEQ